VTIPVASSLSTEGTASPSSLIFNAVNWNTFRTVTVTGQNDAVTDALHPYQITLGLTSSGDPKYDSKTPAAVDVINDDNEPEATDAGDDAQRGGAQRPRLVHRVPTGDTTAALTVNYTVSGTATAGADYTALSGSVSIPAGQSRRSSTWRCSTTSSSEAARDGDRDADARTPRPTR
jgi:hypothetical protein